MRKKNSQDLGTFQNENGQIPNSIGLIRGNQLNQIENIADFKAFVNLKYFCVK
jgi:hypothetical protein